MDRRGRQRTENDRIKTHKRKSQVGIDKKLVRLHQRSVAQQHNRDAKVCERRKISTLSPMAMEMSPLQEVQNRLKKGTKGEESKKCSRKEMLDKWRKEKELKRRLELKFKKPVFKVSHVVEEAAPTGNTNLKGTKQQQSKMAAGPEVHVNPPTRVTRQSARLAAAQNKKDSASSAPAKRNTRSAAASKAVKSQTTTKKKTENVTQRSNNQEMSFAPIDFTFTAPQDLSSIVFKPLSPASAASFVFPSSIDGSSYLSSPASRRRCSTPKRQLNTVTVTRTPIATTLAHSSPAAIDKSKEDSDKAGHTDKAVHTDKARHTDKTEVSSNESKRVQNDSAAFKTPVSGPRRTLARSSGKRPLTSVVRTPQVARRFQTMSPEEKMDVITHSPMVETRRRTPKLTSPGQSVEPLPVDFDDLPVMDDMAAMDNKVITNDMSAMDNKVVMNDEAVTDDKAITDDKSVVEDKPVIDDKPVMDDKPILDDKLVPMDVTEEEHNVAYFRRLLVSETERLNSLCVKWETQLNEIDLSDDITGQIRTTIGQAHLLMNQRFKQFSGLVDNCEFGTGEKETLCSDLQGFWDMIYFQVEDVDKKFADLDALKACNWVKDEPKKVVKKKKTTTVKPAVTKPAAKSKFAAFRAQMKKKTQMAEEVKTFEAPGFFAITSPVRSPKPHCEGGTPTVRSPLRKAVLTRSINKLTPGLNTSGRRSVSKQTGRTSAPSTPVNMFLRTNVFTPDSLEATPCRRSPRRSTRKSLLTPLQSNNSPALKLHSSHDKPAPTFELSQDEQPADDFFSKYLVPTQSSMSEQEHTQSKLATPDDPLRGVRKTPRRSSNIVKTPKSSTRNLRRSVRFTNSPSSVVGSPSKKLPGTPFSRPTSHLVNSEFVFTPPTGGTPTTQMANLHVNGSSQAANLLFTPPQTSTQDVASDLMVFSPLTFQ